MGYFATGIAAGSEGFLWKRESFSTPPTSETLNTQVKLWQAGDYRINAVLTTAPGVGESVTITPVISGVDGTPMAINETDRTAQATITITMGQTLSFKAALSGGSADVGNIMVGFSFAGVPV